jgi:hypothetical protein
VKKIILVLLAVLTSQLSAMSSQPINGVSELINNYVSEAFHAAPGNYTTVSKDTTDQMAYFNYLLATNNYLKEKYEILKTNSTNTLYIKHFKDSLLLAIHNHEKTTEEVKASLKQILSPTERNRNLLNNRLYYQKLFLDLLSECKSLVIHSALSEDEIIKISLCYTHVFTFTTPYTRHALTMMDKLINIPNAHYKEFIATIQEFLAILNRAVNTPERINKPYYIPQTNNDVANAVIRTINDTCNKASQFFQMDPNGYN